MYLPPPPHRRRGGSGEPRLRRGQARLRRGAFANAFASQPLHLYLSGIHLVFIWYSSVIYLVFIWYAPYVDTPTCRPRCDLGCGRDPPATPILLCTLTPVDVYIWYTPYLDTPTCLLRCGPGCSRVPPAASSHCTLAPRRTALRLKWRGKKERSGQL